MYVGFACVYVAQQISIKGAYTARSLLVHLCKTWLKKNWHITLLVTTVACTRLALLVTMSSEVPKSAEKPVVLFSSKKRSNHEVFSDTEDFSGQQQVLGNNMNRYSDSLVRNSL